MRQKLQNLFFLFLLGTIGAKAQGPVITAAGVNPQIGESMKFQSVKIFPSDTSFSGANKVGDFSKLIDSGSSEIYSFVSPVGLPFADSFPTATIAYEVANWVEYDQTNSTGWGEVGFYSWDTTNSNQPYINGYSPRYPLMVYPMSFGSIHTDSIQSYSANIPNNSPYTGTLYDSLIGVGYGTLKIPTGTYNNVLCVYNNGEYLFWANGIHFPLLLMFQAYNNNGLISGSWQASYYAGSPLPLQISSFTASWQNKMPYLQWDAANTENTKAFNIQRSVDGYSFSTVGQVGVSGGSFYHFEDNYIPTSTVYYRLQQVDKNGQSFYSATAQLTVNSKQLTVYPNPAKGTIHVSVPSGNTVYVMIYDAIGRLVYENKTYSSAQPIATDTWSKGTYLVRVKDNDGWKGSSFVID